MKLKIDAHLIDVNNIAQLIRETFDDVDGTTQQTFHRLVIQLQFVLTALGNAASAQLDREKNLKGVKFVFRGYGALQKCDAELNDWRRRIGDAIFSLALFQGRRMPAIMMQRRSRTLNDLAGILKLCLTEEKDKTQLALSDQELPRDPGHSIIYSAVKSHTSSIHYISEVKRRPATAKDIRDVAAFLQASNTAYVALLE